MSIGGEYYLYREYNSGFVYVEKPVLVEIPRPNTLGNGVEDYVGRVIDDYVEMFKGLLRKLRDAMI